MLRTHASLEPVIAAVNGPGVGVGATMMLAADNRMTSKQARFGVVVNRRGVVPESCPSWFPPGWCRCRPRWSGPSPDASSRHRRRRRTAWCVAVHPSKELLASARTRARDRRQHRPVPASLSRQLLRRMLGATTRWLPTRRRPWPSAFAG